MCKLRLTESQEKQCRNMARCTGQLTGSAGSMTIKIENGKHSHDFAYTIAESH